MFGLVRFLQKFTHCRLSGLAGVEKNAGLLSLAANNKMQSWGGDNFLASRQQKRDQQFLTIFRSLCLDGVASKNVGILQ